MRRSFMSGVIEMPCKNCADRRIDSDTGYNCHNDCKRYLEAKAENERKKKYNADKNEASREALRVSLGICMNHKKWR